ncbi:hypothetical protein ACFV6E_32605 [Streptomyces sp. NPDC059785]|uniref:hypothetical protein n=1 Tax=Streptomyces sp. NPDC059785 TaxID=3346945 RepID=UPI00365B1ED5
MKLVLWRVLLAPLTSWRAWRIRQRSTAPLSYDAAWRRARLHRSPDEMVYRLHGHQAPTAPPTEDHDHSRHRPPGPA